VLRVQDNSPGQKAGLEPFFDFVVAIGNVRLNEDNDSLREVLKQNVDKPVPLTVYSTKTQTARQVSLVPSAAWGGQGLLGVSIRFCSIPAACENVWHVVTVLPNSPGALAGLIGGSDFIIGADTVLQDSDDLYNLIEAHEGQPLKLYVYNTQTDSCREVLITPNSQWGDGNGGLTGCDIAYGYLHRIPVIERGAEASQAELEAASVVPNAGQMPPASFAQMPPSGYPPQMLPTGGYVQMPQFPPGTYPVQMGYPMMPPQGGALPPQGPPPGAAGVSVSMSGGALDGTQHAPPQQMPQFAMPMSSQATPFVPPSLAGHSGFPPPPAQSTPANKPVESSAPATSAASPALNGPPPAFSAPTSQPLPQPSTTSAAPASPPTAVTAGDASKAPQSFYSQMPPPPPAGYPTYASLPPTSFVGTSGATFLPPPPSLAGLSGMPPTSAFAQLNLSGPAPWLTGGAPSGVGQLPPPPPRMLFSYTTSGLSAPFSGATYSIAGPSSLPPPPLASAMGKPGVAALSSALPPPPPAAATS
jgi:hypothetical protein